MKCYIPFEVKCKCGEIRSITTEAEFIDLVGYENAVAKKKNQTYSIQQSIALFVFFSIATFNRQLFSVYVLFEDLRYLRYHYYTLTINQSNHHITYIQYNLVSMDPFADPNFRLKIKCRECYRLERMLKMWNHKITIDNFGYPLKVKYDSECNHWDYLQICGLVTRHKRTVHHKQWP